MKTKLSILITTLLFCIYPTFAQNLSFGIESGINFSNINKKLTGVRYVAQPGPVNGIFAKYELGNWFIIQSGVNHATFYFNNYSNNHYYPDYYPMSSSYYNPSSLHSSSIWAPPCYYGYNQSKYSFLRIPLLVKFKTPGRLNFEIGGGAYYAFLTNDELRGKDKEIYDKEFRDENFPPMNDWGWILASSVNYNINKRWNIFVSGQITTGKEEYFEDIRGKIGSTELMFGVGYKPFISDRSAQVKDSTLGRNIRIIPHIGMNFSHTKNSLNSDEYKSSVGFSSGISLEFRLGNGAALSTGAWYERKGYGLNYKGTNSFIYQIQQSGESTIQSEVELDYVTIPLQFEILFGKKINSSINLGPYFSLLQNAFSQGERIETRSHNTGYQIEKIYFNESLDQWIKKTDAGFMIGYRLGIPVFKWGDIFISANQAWGLMNILTNNDDSSDQTSQFSNNRKIRNNSFSVIFGLNIPVSQN